MTIQFSGEDRSPVDLLESTEGFLREIAEEVVRALRDVRSGNLGDGKVTAQAVRDLRAAFQLVMEERTRVEKLRSKVADVVGGGTLDFDAARDEIGRRLARLRDAGNG